MKKITELAGDTKFPWLKNLVRIMKLTTFLILFSVVCIFASETYSQSKKLNLNMKNATVKEVLSAIEDQSEFKFMYSGKVIDVNREVAINEENAKIEDALKSLFAGTDVEYTIKDRIIVLSPSTLINNEQTSTQQQKSISGKVTDSLGGTLPGVSVVVKGTTIGTITDANGNYNLPNVPSNATLVFSFVGMKTQGIVVGNNSTINVELREETIGIEEVVAIGYGTQKKENLTGSVASVSSNLLEKRSVTQSSQLLQGAASGVTVTQASGQPGNDQANIVIRGLGTFSGAGNNPLVLVDGVTSSLNSVSPSDIKSISVLKDAASASIYGSRAANGVILITTKDGTGKGGKLQVSYEAYAGMQEPTQLPQYVDSWTYAEMLNEARNNEGLGKAYPQEVIDKFKSGQFPDEYANKQHVKDLFNSGNGLQTRHNISATGSQGGTQYLFSTGYLKQNGIVDKVDYERYDYRLNLTSKLKDNLTMYARLSGNFSTRNEPAMLYEGGLGGFDAILRSTGIPATVPGEKSDGTYGVYMGHPTAEAGLASDSFVKTRNSFFMSNFSFEWNIVKSLKFTTRIAYDWGYNRVDNFGALFSWDNKTIEKGPSKLQVNTTTTNNLLTEAYFDFERNFGKHYVHLLGGFSETANNTESVNAYRENSPSTKLYVLNAFASQNQTNSGGASTVKLSSFFGRFNYRYQEKYLLEGNLRYDGSSRFPKNTRFGLFPSLSAGWIISNEDFFKIPWVENLKLRSSYGTLGNQQIGNYPYQKTLNLNQPYPFGTTESLFPGIALTTLPFQNITWESVTSFNQGVDVGFLNGKLNISIEHYDRKTSDILYNLTVSSVLGMSVSNQNAGKVENKGWDFELTYKNKLNDFSYSIQPNFSVNHNQILSLAGVEKDISKGLFVGEPLGAIYGYKTDGLFIDQNDIDNYPVQNYAAKPGLIRYKDISGPDGKPDGIISSVYDRTVIGSTNPKYSFGLGIQADYKSFDFFMQLQGLAGFKRQISGMQLALFNNGNMEQWQVDNRWTTANPDRNAAYPRLTELSSSPEAPFGDVSEYWLRNASFLRLKTIQLGYNIPSSIINKTFIDHFRVYVSGQNVITWNSYYTGWDPEMGTGGYANSSYYPPTRLWIVGLSVNF